MPYKNPAEEGPSFRFRLSEGLAAKLDRFAELTGLSRAGVARMLLELATEETLPRGLVENADTIRATRQVR